MRRAAYAIKSMSSCRRCWAIGRLMLAYIDLHETIFTVSSNTCAISVFALSTASALLHSKHVTFGRKHVIFGRTLHVQQHKPNANLLATLDLASLQSSVQCGKYACLAVSAVIGRRCIQGVINQAGRQHAGAEQSPSPAETSPMYWYMASATCSLAYWPHGRLCSIKYGLPLHSWCWTFACGWPVFCSRVKRCKLAASCSMLHTCQVCMNACLHATYILQH